MGITNFTLLINCFDGEQFNESFDSILIDIQSLIYVAIDQTLSTTNESDFFFNLSDFVQKRLAQMIKDVFQSVPFHGDRVTIICSFDGEGVPMKWPTQRTRREKGNISNKNVYRVSLFGNNRISKYIQDQLIQSLKDASFKRTHFQHHRNLPDHMIFYISGCNVEGEGEHKIFHMAEALSDLCKRPVIVSVDNDVFLLAFARIAQFDCLQLYKGNKLYNLTHFVHHMLPFSVDAFIFASLLFGNDFIPPIVRITPSNYGAIHTLLASTCESIVENDLKMELPIVVHRFLKSMESSLKFSVTPELDRNLLIRFWITCLWILDYYTKRDFPQKYATNQIFDNFNRCALLTGLLDEEIANETFREAEEVYRDASSLPQDSPEFSIDRVFGDLQPEISKYLIHREENDGYCYEIRIRTLKRKRK